MLKVCCAIIECNNKILVAQRSSSMVLPLKWEFPGGKIENEECEEVCIVREIQEELGMDITVKTRLTPVIYHYEEFSLELIPFICEVTNSTFQITEHTAVCWATLDELSNFDWASADIPIVNEYKKLWS